MLFAARSGAVSFLLSYSSSSSLSSSFTLPSLGRNEILNCSGNHSDNNNSKDDNNICNSSGSLESKYDINLAMVRSLGFRIEKEEEHISNNYLRENANGKDNRSLSMGLLCSLPRYLTSSGKYIRSIYTNSPFLPFFLSFFP